MRNPFRRKPQPPTNDELLKAIMVMATSDTPDSWRNFYTVLLKSTLLIAEEPDHSGPILLGDDEKVILPVFTDTERLHKVFPDAVRFGAIPARDLFKLALKNEIDSVNLNPQHGPGGFVDRDEMEALAKGEIPDLSAFSAPSLSSPNFIPMGDPKLPSQEIIDKLTDSARFLIEKEGIVKEAYMIMTTRVNESVMAIALYFNSDVDEDRKAAFSQLLVPMLEGVIQRPMDLMWLEGERYEAIASVVPPFYTRE
jgi:hypothetical protein